MRRSSLSDSLYHLIQTVLGGKSNGSPNEMTIRLLVLKNNLYELLHKKLSELAVIVLMRRNGGEALGELRPISCLLELVKFANGEDGVSVERLRDELRKLKASLTIKDKLIEELQRKIKLKDDTAD